MNLKKIKDINQQAMLEASRAISKLMQGPVKIAASIVELKKTNELAGTFPRQEEVIGLSSHLTSDTEGSAMMILPSDTALALCDLLLKKDRGTTQTIAGEEVAVLQEVANIVIGNYLRAFSMGLGLKCMLHSVADFSCNTFDSLIGMIVPNISDDKDKAVFIEILFTFQQATVKGYLMLLLEAANLEEALGGSSHDDKS